MYTTNVQTMNFYSVKNLFSVENKRVSVSQLAKPYLLTLKSNPTLDLRVGRTQNKKLSRTHAYPHVGMRIAALEKIEIPKFVIKIHCEKYLVNLFQYYDREDMETIKNYAEKICWLRNEENIFHGEEIFLTDEDDFEEAKYLLEIKKQRSQAKEFTLILHEVLGFIEDKLRDSFFCFLDIFNSFRRLSLSYVERILTELKKQDLIKVSYKEKARCFYVLNYQF